MNGNGTPAEGAAASITPPNGRPGEAAEIPTVLPAAPRGAGLAAGPGSSGLPPGLLGMSQGEIETAMSDLGEPRFRARQLMEWVHGRRATDFRALSNLGAGLRSGLAEHFALRTMELVQVQGSSDTTRKFLFRLRDGRYVETVLIPASPALYGEASDRRTLCVSSQVGCAYGCRFCASGLAGFARNLDAGEIVEQLVQVEEHSGERVSNIVFMGMGEPLANFGNLVRAIEILNAPPPWGAGVGARHMTVSTSGLAPEIRRLADLPLQIRLAISLHGATDEVRGRIMPVNRKYPLETLFEALRYWASHRKQRLTFEYILIDGVNDSDEDAEALASRCVSVRAKVNLIPYNTVDGLEWRRPDEPRQDQFLAILRRHGVAATLRREKGHDIDAACGQLRLRQETDDGLVTAPAARG